MTECSTMCEPSHSFYLQTCFVRVSLSFLRTKTVGPHALMLLADSFLFDCADCNSGKLSYLLCKTINQNSI